MEVFFIGLIILVVILAIRKNNQNKLQEELRQKRFFEELQRKKEEERAHKEEAERKRLDELNNETIVVVYEAIDENNKPTAIVKRSNNTYASVERKGERFEILEEIRISKEKIANWNWYDEVEYKRQLIEKKSDIARQQALERQRKQSQILDRFGIDYLFHMTHKDNLQNILQNGLQSHNQARKSNLTRVDISDNQVNDRRERLEPINNISIHNYVPLYFNPKNPMLFRRRNIQDEIIILCLDKQLIYQKKSLFSDGNAASNSTQFYSEITDLDKLNWNCINADYWNDFSDGKRIRCAEVLVYQKIDTKLIKKILCNNIHTKKFIQNMITNFNYHHIAVEVDESMYFYYNNRTNFDYISESEIDDLPF